MHNSGVATSQLPLDLQIGRKPALFAANVWWMWETQPYTLRCFNMQDRRKTPDKRIPVIGFATSKTDK